MRSPWEEMTDEQLRELPLAQLFEARAEVRSACVLIEGQLATAGKDADRVPYSPDGPPPERKWRHAARTALAHKRAFLVRLKPLINARNNAGDRHPRTMPPGGREGTDQYGRRRAYHVLADLYAELTKYSFDHPDEARVRELLAEAGGFVKRVEESQAVQATIAEGS